MSFITSWFRRAQEEDYETVLQNLALSIQNRQSRLSDIRQRETRSTLLATLYALVAWLLYVSCWYTGLIPYGSTRGGGLGFNNKFLRTTPLFLGPIACVNP